MAVIRMAHIRKILDSRADATVEVDLVTDEGVGRAAAPSGASRGAHEPVPYPHDSLKEAIETFRAAVAPKLEGVDASDQVAVDATLHEVDGTPNFAYIGGNVATATSMAAARAAAAAAGMPLYRYLGGSERLKLPFPVGNVVGGGKHAIGGPDIQEFHALSLAPSFQDAVFANALVYHRVLEALKDQFPDAAIGRGDEAAWVAPLTNEVALDILSEICLEVSQEVQFPVRLGLDLAASGLYREGKYHYKEGAATPDKQVEFVADLVDGYDLYYVEDPLHEDDFAHFARLTDLVGHRALVVGDDIFVTNAARVAMGAEKGAANAVLIKPNQAGTLTDAAAAVRAAQRAGWKTIASHRSWETTDDCIGHAAVGWGCQGLKAGVAGGERIAKLNEGVRIEEELRGT